MIDAKVDGTPPEHVDRLTPHFTVDDTGKITWVPGFIDYDARQYSRGKQVTSDEFNNELLKQVYQGNYITDSLDLLLNEYLETSIHNTFINQFNLYPSYIKEFGSSDWGILQSDGYYYITIPASEHGFIADPDQSELERMNLDTEVYVLNADGKFIEVSQVIVDSNNTVYVYSDDPTLIGFIVIRTNDKSYRIANTTVVPAENITGLATVAYTGKATDLADYTKSDGTGVSDRINKNTSDITKIISGVQAVGKAIEADTAEYAENLPSDSTIQNILVSDIFETGSRYVKDATHATNADKATADANNDNIINTYAKKNGTYANMTVGNADHATNADNASTAAALNGTVSSTTTGTTKSNNTNDTTMATTAFVHNLITSKTMTCNTYTATSQETGGGLGTLTTIVFANGVKICMGTWITASNKNWGDVPLPFTTNCWSVVASPKNNNDDVYRINIREFDSGHFRYRVTEDRTDITFIAIGY